MVVTKLDRLGRSLEHLIHGQACIRGTRIPVSVVLDCLADGMSEADIVAGSPTLTVEGIRAAAAYCAALASEERVLPRDRGDALLSQAGGASLPRSEGEHGQR